MPKLWLCIVLLLFCAAAPALQRQQNADYKARREAVGKKLGGSLSFLARWSLSNRSIRFVRTMISTIFQAGRSRVLHC